jgi:Mrp family chromosome partitioning ATPase
VQSLGSEALATCVRATGVKGLSLLTTGNADGAQAGNLSPAAVHRLIGEARSNFEVVLVDSGPMLGCIEASLFAPEADGVILIVTRGQHRPIVDSALKHLKAVGGQVIGMVFNRAKSTDIYGSLSGSSRRSVMPAVPGANGAGNAPAFTASAAIVDAVRGVETVVKRVQGAVVQNMASNSQNDPIVDLKN